MTPSEDSYRCWEVAIALKREALVRSGAERPVDEHEARWAAEGQRPVQQLDSMTPPHIITNQQRGE